MTNRLAREVMTENPACCTPDTPLDQVAMLMREHDCGEIPVIDPDRLLKGMTRPLGWIFSLWFFILSIGLMLGAVTLVATHFETFRSKLPNYHEFFSFKTVVYLWAALAVVKRTREALDAGRTSSLAARIEAGETLTPLMLAQEAETGDELSMEIILDTARYLGVGVVSVMHTIDPSGVVLGGAMNFGCHQTTVGRRFIERAPMMSPSPCPN